MLCAVLRYFEGAVAQGQHFVLHPFYLVSEDDGEFAVFQRIGLLSELDAVVHLLDGVNGIALLLQLADAFDGVVVIAPLYAFFGAEGGLVDVAVWRCGADSAEGDVLDAEGVGGAEDGAYVVLAAYVVEHDGQRHFGAAAELVDGEAVHFVCCKFVGHF